MKFTTNAEAAKGGGGDGAASTAVLINAALDHNEKLGVSLQNYTLSFISYLKNPLQETDLLKPSPELI